MAPYRLLEFAELDSTNRYACAHLRELAHGDVIQARVQTAGRGRWQRAWISHVPGNLCLSFVLKPQGAPPDRLPLANFSQWLAVSTCRVLESQHVRPALKWPNDIQVNGRKIAGILAETVVEGGDFLGLVLGIGVNLNLDAATLSGIDQPATSLSQVLGRAVGLEAFRDALLAEFWSGCQAFELNGFPLIRDEYLTRCAFLAKTVEVRRGDTVARGRVRTVNDSGELELMTANGELLTVSLGEMFVEPNRPD